MRAKDKLREIRNILLRDCDWRMTEDYPYDDKEAWKIYRQQLRDLPNTQRPEWDNNNLLIGIEWPIKPE